MKARRKRHNGAFKAKVGLDAIMGIKPVAQIAREYQVHPTQVTQWKAVIRERLPELFEAPENGTADQERLLDWFSSLGGSGNCSFGGREQPAESQIAHVIDPIIA